MLLWGSIIIGYFLCIVISNLIYAMDSDRFVKIDKFDDSTRQVQMGFIVIDRPDNEKFEYSFFPIFMLRNIKNDECEFACLGLSFFAPIHLAITTLFSLGSGIAKLSTRKNVMDIIKLRIYTKGRKK